MKKKFTTISSNIQELKGVGHEWLVDKQGNVIVLFYDGDIVRKNFISNSNEDTVLEAA